MVLKRHFHEVFVLEKVPDVVDVLRKNGIVVDYNDTTNSPRTIMGHIDGGIIMDCEVCREENRIELLIKNRLEAWTCIELQSSNANFSKLVDLISEKLTVIEDDCMHCNLSESAK